MLKVVILGADHYNALSVVRLAGEAGYRPVLILTSDDKINPTAYSKYIGRVVQVSEHDEEKIIEAVKKEASTVDKVVVIPTGDPVAVVLDQHYNELKDDFILPNICGRQGEITKHMDKLFQYNLCQKYKIRTAKTWSLTKDNYKREISELPDRVIIKPEVSASGDKADIVTAYHSEVEERLVEIFKKGYREILVQEYIPFDKEQSMMGVAMNGEVIVPGIVNKLVLTPNKAGTSSYGEIIPTKKYDYNITQLADFVKKIKYNGLFEIEFFIKDGEVYFNELNLRNSANVYAFMGDEVNYVNIYLSFFEKKTNIKKYVQKNFYYCQDSLHLKNAKMGAVRKLDAIKHVFSSTDLVYNSKDMKPYFMKFYKKIRRGK